MGAERSERVREAVRTWIFGASLGCFAQRKMESPSMSASVTAPLASTCIGLKKRTAFMRASWPPRLPSIVVSKYLAAGETTALARASSTATSVRSVLESRCVSDGGTTESDGGAAEGRRRCGRAARA